MTEFLIGHFFDNQREMNEAYEKHVAIMSKYPEVGKVLPREHAVIDMSRRHQYFYVDERGRWKQRIMGLQFQGVFANVKHLSDRHYILSRFRPRIK